ncbi:MAG: MBL fold metallo-hydrolase [Leptospiraceae bacterium]|nr:MAG: MBL fold metallo-hydrolase [Leptospiraceae bacterium]
MILTEYHYKDFTFIGNSEGGIHTSIAIPRLKIMFDTGIGSPNLVEIPKILLTHGHLDHASGLAYLISQRSLRKLSPPEVYIPPHLYEPLDKILKLWHQIENYESKYHLIPVNYNDLYPLQGNYYFKAIPSVHRVPSNGYVIFEKRKKLKKEYLHLPGYKIAELKKTNPDIIETRLEPIITFSGDTQIEFVLENEVVQNTKILFLECTYICDKRPVERARKWGHIHLYEIIENAEYFRNIQKLYLIHFSPRYRKKEIKETLKKLLPDWLYKKTTPFLTKEIFHKQPLESVPENS